MSKKNTVEAEASEDLSLDIPASWGKATLGTLVDYLDHLRRPISKENRISGPVPYYGANGLQGYHNAHLFNETLLLLAEDGGHFGSKDKDIAYIISGKTWVNNHAHVLRPKSQISINFLFQYLRKFDVRPWVTGATVPKLNQQKSRTIPVVVPPYREQVRISEKIESIFLRVDVIEKAADEAEKLLQKYRESILAKAFRGELVPQDPSEGTGHDLLARIRSESNEATTSKKKKASTPQAAANEVSLDIPESWAITSLDSVCDLITCGTAARPEYTSSGIPFLSAKNVQGEKVYWSNYQYISEKTHKELTKNNKPKLGDILYTRVGSYGEAAIVDKDIEFSVFVSLTLIKPTPSIVLNTFLKYFLNSESVKRLAKKSITGVGVGNLNVGAVRTFPTPIPPLSEQKRIVTAIEKHESTIEELQTNINSLKTQAKKLRESILASAFSGKLVPQDPSEGTGHELLEQIRASTTTPPNSEDVTDAAPKKSRKKRPKK